MVSHDSKRPLQYVPALLSLPFSPPYFISIRFTKHNFKTNRTLQLFIALLLFLETGVFWCFQRKEVS